MDCRASNHNCCCCVGLAECSCCRTSGWGSADMALGCCEAHPAIQAAAFEQECEEPSVMMDAQLMPGLSERDEGS